MTVSRLTLAQLFTQLFTLLLSLACLPLASAAEDGVGGSVDGVVVCPAEFRDEIEPWLAHRRSEGLTIAVIDSERDADTLVQKVRAAADDATRYVALIGDAPTIGTVCDPLKQIPMHYRPTTVTAKWGSTPTLSSDLSFGDFDGDGIPEAVVGRMPVDTKLQASRQVARILAYENSSDFGPWRGQVQLVGGVGGFGMMVDTAIESVTRTVVTGVLPIETKTHVAYASVGHPFCPVGDTFTNCVLSNYWRGSRFWVYAGHGRVTELDRFPQTEAGIPVLDRNSCCRLDRPDGSSPIAVLLACYTGAMDAPEDSIAEEMWLADGGPVAVVAGSRVTMPYGNATAAIGLIGGVFSQKLPRLGDAWLSALEDMHQEKSPDTSTARMMIDALAAMISPTAPTSPNTLSPDTTSAGNTGSGSNLVDERREHMLLYNLIGDPMLSMHHPLPITISLPASHASGDVVEVSVTSPLSGDLLLSVDRPLGGVTDGDPNNTTIATLQHHAEAARTSLSKFKLPIGTHGPVIVRAIVSGKAAWASGAAQTILRAPSK